MKNHAGWGTALAFARSADLGAAGAHSAHFVDKRHISPCAALPRLRRQ